MEVGKNIIRRTLSLILVGVFERSPRRRNFQLKIGLIFSDISEDFHDLLQNRIGLWNRHESMINKTTWAICVAVSVFFLTERTLFRRMMFSLFFFSFQKEPELYDCIGEFHVPKILEIVSSLRDFISNSSS